MWEQFHMGHFLSYKEHFHFCLEHFQSYSDHLRSYIEHFYFYREDFRCHTEHCHFKRCISFLHAGNFLIVFILRLTCLCRCPVCCFLLVLCIRLRSCSYLCLRLGFRLPLIQSNTSSFHYMCPCHCSSPRVCLYL